MRVLALLPLVFTVGCAQEDTQASAPPTCRPEKADYCSALIYETEVTEAQDLIDLFDENQSECYCDEYLARQKFYMLRYGSEEEARTFEAEWEAVTGHLLFPGGIE